MARVSPLATPALPASGSRKVSITLLGRDYLVACDPGDEARLEDIAALVEDKLRDATERGGPGAGEARLFMLACLFLADEVLESRRSAKAEQEADEDLMVAAVEHLRQRVATLAERIGRV